MATSPPGKSIEDRQFLVGCIFVLTAACAFSAKAIFIKLAYAYGARVDAITLMTLRMLIALPFFLGVALWTRRDTGIAALSKRDWLNLVFLGILGYYLASFLDFSGLVYISASLERLILFLYPTLVVLFSALYYGRSINRHERIALMLSYAGIALVFLDNLANDSPRIVLGAALIFASAVSFAVFLLGSGVMTRRIGSARFTAYSMTVSCVATGMHFGATHGIRELLLPERIYALAVLLAIVSTVVPAFLMNAGIRRIGSGSASIISSVGPVSTLVLAYFLLDESINTIQIIGTVLVLYGVYRASRSRPA